MRPIISAKDIEELMRNGGDPNSLPEGAVLTPSARDLLRGLDTRSNRKIVRSSVRRASTEGTVNETERFFHSAELQGFKEQICDIGRRLWQRAYVDGNGGNLSIRVSDHLVLCTPTLVSKGFMKPEDLCLVDLEGNQKAGSKKRTSEILMHLQIMKAQPKAKAVCHCHPPHATAFAVAGVEPPTCMIPEIEVFIGKVPIAPYLTPGTPEMGAKVAELVDQHNTVLMANHGVVSWSHNLEDTYFKMEILEAYCRTIVVAAQLSPDLRTFSTEHLQDLLKIKKTMDIPDSRFGLKECELCDNDGWRPGVTCDVSPENAAESSSDPDAEAIVQAITDQIMSRMKSS